MRDTNTVFLEVMRKDDPAKLNHYADVGAKKFEDSANSMSKGAEHTERKLKQYTRLSGKSFDADKKVDMANKAAKNNRMLKGAGIGLGVAAAGYGAYKLHKRRQQQKAQESTATCFSSLMEVMRKDDPKLLRHLVDKASMKMIRNLAQSPDKTIRGRDVNQYIRLSRKLGKAAPAQPPKWSFGKKAAVGLGAGALAYGAYRWNKNRQQKQKAKESTSQYFARMLREAETRINADHIALGLNVLKATGFDQAMARQMGDDKQRSQAWKYGLRGAALGASLPALEYGAKTAYHLGMHALDARRNGVRGVGDILRYARDHRFGAIGYPSATMQAAHELGRAYTSNPALLGKVVGGLAGAGALYGLMKKAPSDKKPTPTLMKPKKQYKYIRKDGDKYVYPKKIGVKK